MEITKRVKIFISYSTHSRRDKDTASAIKSHLEEFDMEVFLAHEDIRSGENWRKTMLKALESCDIFMPIMTESIKESEWATQEMGFAFAIRKDKMILPLKDGANPRCMLEIFQGLQCAYLEGGNEIDSEKTFSIIIDELISGGEHPDQYKSVLKRNAIEGLLRSKNFMETRRKYMVLRKYDSFTENEIDSIIEATEKNDQVRQYAGSPGFFRYILRTMKASLSLQQKKKIQNLAKN